MFVAVFFQVFGKVRYILLGTVLAAVVFVLATWLPNLGLVWQIAASATVPLVTKIDILIALVGSIATNFTFLSALSTFTISVLFGVNVAMITYYFWSHRKVLRQAGHAAAAANIGGVASGLAGVGCAACGTVALSPLLSFFGATSLISLLPFGGEEFALLGIGLLIFSIALTAKRIGASPLCPIRRTDEPECHKGAKKSVPCP